MEKRLVPVGEVKLSGGKLPREYRVHLTLDWTGVGLDEAIQLGSDSSSPRVKWAGHAREHVSDATASRWEREGLTIHVRECGKAVLDPAEQARQARLGALTYIRINHPNAKPEDLPDLLAAWLANG